MDPGFQANSEAALQQEAFAQSGFPEHGPNGWWVGSWGHGAMLEHAGGLGAGAGGWGGVVRAARPTPLRRARGRRVMYRDKGSGDPYYHNHRTNVTQWERWVWAGHAAAASARGTPLSVCARVAQRCVAMAVVVCACVRARALLPRPAPRCGSRPVRPPRPSVPAGQPNGRA